jgi:hypothetical protein
MSPPFPPPPAAVQERGIASINAQTRDPARIDSAMLTIVADLVTGPPRIRRGCVRNATTPSVRSSPETTRLTICKVRGCLDAMQRLRPLLDDGNSIAVVSDAMQHEMMHR